MTTKGGDPHHLKQCYTSTHYNSPSPNLKGDRLPTNFPPPPPPPAGPYNIFFIQYPVASAEPPPLIVLNMAVPPLAPEPICSTTPNASPGPPSLPTPKPFARRWFPTSNGNGPVFSPAFPTSPSVLS
eukprot:scaffold3639_cov141-Isochrysis_galbana.AAC.15